MDEWMNERSYLVTYITFACCPALAAPSATNVLNISPITNKASLFTGNNTFNNVIALEMKNNRQCEMTALDG